MFATGIADCRVQKVSVVQSKSHEHHTPKLACCAFLKQDYSQQSNHSAAIAVLFDGWVRLTLVPLPPRDGCQHLLGAARICLVR